eukprot:533017-Pelagomonas_calceolata.AAC.8
MAPCARPSPSQYVDADCGSAFQPFPRTSKNWGTNTEVRVPGACCCGPHQSLFSSTERPKDFRTMLPRARWLIS